MKHTFFSLLTGLLVLSLGTTAHAQFWGTGDVGGTVQGTGTVTIERQPQRMQMEVDILFRAGSVEDAVAGLQEQIETARLQLVELGAIEDSITVGDPSIDTRQSNQQQMMQQMITPSFGAPARNRPESKAKQPVTLTALMKAEWELDQAATADLLVRTHELQEQIRAADVAGSEAATQLTPEEQEVFEEMQQQYGSYGSDEAKPGEPLFFSSRTSPMRNTGRPSRTHSGRPGHRRKNSPPPPALNSEPSNPSPATLRPTLTATTTTTATTTSRPTTAPTSSSATVVTDPATARRRTTNASPSASSPAR